MNATIAYRPDFLTAVFLVRTGYTQRGGMSVADDILRQIARRV